MKIVKSINLVLFLFLAISLAASGLTAWNSRISAEHVRQVSLSYQVHGHIQSLKSKAFQLFKQFGDAMIIGDLDQGEGEARLIAEIHDTFNKARAAISLEMEFQGEQEIEELEDLAKAERLIEQLIAELTRIAKARYRGDAQPSITEIWQLLDRDIDKTFHSLMVDMLLEEESEVEEALAQVASEAQFYQLTAIGFATLAVFIAVVSVFLVIFSVGRPIRAFMSGIRKFGDTHQARPIDEVGTGEIRELIEVFNLMAERTSEKTKSLASENKALEETAKLRTQQLEQLVSDLTRSENNRQRMLADVSHELRTPLTIIRGEAEIALRGETKPVEVYKDALVRARDAAEHTATLVDDLLFIARKESGQARLKIDSIDLTDEVQETLTTFGYEVSYLPDVAAAPMRGDAIRIRQALMILLENARHHGGTAITVRLSRMPDGFRVAIEDNGPGMTEEEKAHAFERFFRGSNAADRYREGLGLGLPIAQAIGQAHGGMVELYDRPGGGLVAALILPVQPVLKAVA